jgi:hypothetical protein
LSSDVAERELTALWLGAAIKAKAMSPAPSQLIKDLNVMANPRFDFTTSPSRAALQCRKHPSWIESS